jgi:hypothetical protein
LLNYNPKFSKNQELLRKLLVFQSPDAEPDGQVIIAFSEIGAEKGNCW